MTMALSKAAHSTSAIPASSRSSFDDKLMARSKAVQSLLCVGLDPHLEDLFPHLSAADALPAETKCDAAFTFCKTLVEATLPVAACYKPNAAFFEAIGDGGLAVLQRLIRDVIPVEVPVLLDVKRGDIGSTAAAYAAACYDYLGADAVTLSPLMGWDSVEPFVSGLYAKKGAFLLCKTSNPGANELMTLSLNSAIRETSTVYEHIARLVGSVWSAQQPTATLGLVVGATDPVAMAKARAAAGDSVWILAPGVGAQGGDLLQAARAGLNRNGSCVLIPVSRGISRAQDPAQAARELQEQIEAIRAQVVQERASAGSDATSPCVILPHQREFLEFALAEGVLKFGSFELKSGRTSPYFFNAGLFDSGSALCKLGKSYACAIMASDLSGTHGVKFEVLFGPAYKGICLAAVVSSALYSEFGISVGFAYNRKEAKDHGEGGVLVGAAMNGGKRVLIIDDVITAGTAIRESYTLLTQIGAEVVGSVIALDRAEIRSREDRVSAVQAVERDFPLKVYSIVNLPQLQAFLELSAGYSEDLRQSMANYREEFGV